VTARTVSVIVTAYNQAGCVGEAVTSVLAQEGPPVEVMVADDASTDGTPDVIRDLARRHPGVVVPVLAATNRGVSANRNAGLAAATGERITWLDGDDVFLPGKLARETAALDARPDLGWAYSQVTVVDEARGTRRPRYAAPPQGDAFAAIAGMVGRAPRNPLVAREVLEAAGGFDEGLALYEDFDIMLRLARRAPCAYVPKPGMEYRMHGGGLHAGAAARHAASVERLAENFARLTQELPPRERRRARRAFRHGRELLLMGTDLAAGDRGGAARHLLRGLSLKPSSVLRADTLRAIAGLLRLPAGPRPPAGARR
jgi:glycosyltransferase involved in cell wall biosynthesis